MLAIKGGGAIPCAKTMRFGKRQASYQKLGIINKNIAFFRLYNPRCDKKHYKVRAK